MHIDFDHDLTNKMFTHFGVKTGKFLSVGMDLCICVCWGTISGQWYPNLRSYIIFTLILMHMVCFKILDGSLSYTHSYHVSMLECKIWKLHFLCINHFIKICFCMFISLLIYTSCTEKKNFMLWKEYATNLKEQELK